jgi:predicted Kef-type K+ transport protein
MVYYHIPLSVDVIVRCSFIESVKFSFIVEGTAGFHCKLINARSCNIIICVTCIEAWSHSIMFCI